MDEETYWKHRLAELHKAYSLEAEPIIRRLAAIEAMKPPRPFILDVGRLSAEESNAIGAALAKMHTANSERDLAEARIAGVRP